MRRIVVIGGGAAGLIAAGTAARRGHKVIVVERNERMARKVMITGKGRCNVTNTADPDRFMSHIPTNARFLYSAFHCFSAQDTMRLFEGLGVALKVERGGRVFPVSDRAVDIVDGLVRYAREGGAQLRHGRVVDLIVEEGSIRGVRLEDRVKLEADAVVLSTGGKSYPATGSTGDGYRMAAEVGHTIMPLMPSLVPLEVHEGFCAQLQGLSLKNVTLAAWDQKRNKKIFEETGEMLFTHFGVSGPLVLSASAHLRPMERERFRLVIDLKPGMSQEQLDKRLLRDFSAYANRDFANSLEDLLPKKLIPVVVALSGIAAHKKVNQLTREERAALCGLLKGLPLHVTGFRPIEEAVVTSGGICVKEVDPKTMESKRVKDLFFAGEILDVDGYTGGFNLQIAFSTGYLAGSMV